MHVALLSAEYPPQPGGVGDYTRQLGQALAQRGHTVTVFTISDFRFQISDLSHQNNRQSGIVDRKSNWGWRSWRDVIGALDQTRPDVLHIQYQTGAYGMHPAINLLPCRLRRLAMRPAIVVTAHDLLPPYLFPKAGPARRWVTRRLLVDSDAAVVTNEDDFAQVYDWRLGIGGWRLYSRRQSPISNLQSPVLIPIGSNIPVAPPEGYDRANWRARLEVQPNETLVAYFGLISRSKGLDTLLGALHLLPAHVRLLVVGGAAIAPEDRAYAEQVRRQIEERDLGRQVTITGQCTAADVSAHLLAADLAALPFADGASFRRGSLLATLAHGLPTVTTTPPEPRTKNREPGVEHTVLGSWSSVPSLVDGEHVLLVPPMDARALAGAIGRLMGDRVLRERLASGARSLAARFTWPEIAARHEELYAALVAAT